MFTGIVEELGRVESVSAEGSGLAMRVDLGAAASGVAAGDSICVDGACLTVETVRQGRADFRLTRESLQKTTLGALAPGRRVHLERSLAVGDRFGGHFVTGHVDGIGEVADVRRKPGDWLVTFEAPSSLRWALVQKGSIAVDGVSLTLVDPVGSRFSVALVTHTLERTTLGERRPGDRVNLEADLVGRWVAHLLADRGESPGLDAARLREIGRFGEA